MVSVSVVVVPQARATSADAVTRWVAVELEEIASHRTNPPRAARGLALVSVAIHRSARLPGRHGDAAVAGAAATVLGYLYSDRAEVFEELAQAETSRIGLRIGTLIGAQVVAEARRDGSDAVWLGQVPVGPGL